jgi:hypothetical protein
MKLRSAAVNRRVSQGEAWHRRWGVPSGRVPTTHILKPPTGEWDSHAENEHFSLRLARAVGLIVPNSTVQHFGDEITIVVERYDRVRSGGRWSRIHQEDMCQALGLHPTNKYESDGRNQPRTYLLNQSIVRCQARSAATLLYRSGVASQLKPCTAPG